MNLVNSRRKKEKYIIHTDYVKQQSAKIESLILLLSATNVIGHEIFIKEIFINKVRK